MRWMILLAIVSGCSSSPTCEQRVRDRMNADPRWGPEKKIRGLAAACKELDGGRAERVPDGVRAKIECILGAEDDTAYDRCATMSTTR